MHAQQTLSGRNSAPESATRWTVVTPVRNGKATIRDCVTSVANQTVSTYHLVQDGLSTDGTLNEIRQAVGDQCAQLMIKTESDRGIYDAVNKGLARAKTEFVAILNSDDYYCDRGILNKAEQAFDQHPNVTIVACNIQYLSRRGISRVTTIPKGIFTLADMLRGEQLPHPGMFVRRSSCENVTYDTTMKISADYKYQLHLLSARSHTAYCIGDIGTTQRTGGRSQKNAAAFILGKREIYRALREELRVNKRTAAAIVARNIAAKLLQLHPPAKPKEIASLPKVNETPDNKNSP